MINAKYFNINTKNELISGINDSSYIEEGELKFDKLNDSFGRRIYGGGNYKLGWFKDTASGNILHGYGIEYSKNENVEGIF